MKASQRMQLVLQLAKRKEDAAAQQWQQQESECQQLRDQIAQLLEYQKEYKERINRGGQLTSATDIMRERQFLQQLSEMEAAQNHVLSQAEQRATTAQQQWQQARFKRDNLDSLVKRLQIEEDLEIERKLQLSIDELSLQAAVRRMQKQDD